MTADPGRHAARPFPRTNDAVEARPVLHKLRSLALENFNEHIKGICDGFSQVAAKAWSTPVALPSMSSSSADWRQCTASSEV